MPESTHKVPPIQDEIVCAIRDIAGSFVEARTGIEPNSLTFKTLVNAGIHYLPQDAVVIGSALWWTRRGNAKMNPRYRWTNPQEGVQQFLRDKGLKQSAITVSRKGGVTFVDLKPLR